jgi:hypothetical protein
MMIVNKIIALNKCKNMIVLMCNKNRIYVEIRISKLYGEN